MRAVRAHRFGGIDELRLDDVSPLVPGPDEIVVDVEAAGVNFADALLVAGRYQVRPELPFSPGFEAAGTISAVGKDVSGLTSGQRVVVTPWYGAYADQLLATSDQIIPLPDDIDAVTAVASVITFGTAYHGLVDRASLRVDEMLLVTGATGGVGSAAIQIGRSLGARVVAAVGSEGKFAAAKDLGASEAVSYEDLEGFRDAIRSASRDGTYDVVFDTVGGDVFEPCVRSLAPGGRALVVGFTAGDIPRIPTNLLLLKEASITGVFWGAFRQRDPEAAVAQLTAVWRSMTSGELRLPPVHVAPLEDASIVLQRLLDREVVGKAVLVTGAGTT